MFFIGLALYIKTLQQIAYFLYRYQLKEYRLDRTKEHLIRTYPDFLHAWIYTTIFAPMSTKMLPQPTMKAVLIAVLGIALYNSLLCLLGPVVLVMGLFISPFFVFAAQAIQSPLEIYVKVRLQKRAHTKIEHLKAKGLKVIGITGSYGKTSTKRLLTHALGLSYNVLTTARSINSPTGISRIVLKQLTDKHDYFVVEMGAYKKGEIQELMDIVDPDIAIITGISNQHIALFGSQKNIIEGKSELLQGSSVHTGYINKDSEHQPIVPRGLTTRVYDASTYKFFIKGSKIPHLPESFKINAGGAFLIAHNEGVAKNALKAAFNNMYEKYCDVREVKGYNQSTIINRAFRGRSPLSSNRIGVLHSIKHLASFPQSVKVMTMPCLIELGDEAKKVHTEIWKSLYKHKIQTYITTSDYYDDIVAAIPRNQTYIKLETDPSHVIEKLKTHASKDTVMLIEGRTHPSIIKFLLEENEK